MSSLSLSLSLSLKKKEKFKEQLSSLKHKITPLLLDFVLQIGKPMGTDHGVNLLV